MLTNLQKPLSLSYNSMSRKSNKNVSGAIDGSMSLSNQPATQDMFAPSQTGSQDVTISLLATPEGSMLSQEKQQFFRNQAVEYKRKYLLEEEKNKKEKEKKSKKREENNKKFNSRLSFSSAEETLNRSHQRSTRSSEKMFSGQVSPFLGQGTKSFSEELAGPSSREGIKNIKDKSKKNRLSLPRKVGANYKTGPLPGPGKPGFPPVLFSDVVKGKESGKAAKKTPGTKETRVVNVGNFSFKAVEEGGTAKSKSKKKTDAGEDKEEVMELRQRQACESGLGRSLSGSGSDKSVNTLGLTRTNSTKNSGKSKTKTKDTAGIDYVDVPNSGINFFSPSVRSSPVRNKVGEVPFVTVSTQLSPIHSSKNSYVAVARPERRNSPTPVTTKQVGDVILTDSGKQVEVATEGSQKGEKSKKSEKKIEKGEKSKNPEVEVVVELDEEEEEKIIEVGEEARDQMLHKPGPSKKMIASIEREFDAGPQAGGYVVSRENQAVPRRGGPAAIVVDLNESIMANQFNMEMDLETVDPELAEAERNRRGALINLQLNADLMQWCTHHNEFFKWRTRSQWQLVLETAGIFGQAVRDETNRSGLLPYKCMPEPDRQALLERARRNLDCFPTYKCYRTGWVEEMVEEAFVDAYGVGPANRAALNEFQDHLYKEKYNKPLSGMSPNLVYAYYQYGWLAPNCEHSGIFKDSRELYLELAGDPISAPLIGHSASYKVTAPPKRYTHFVKSLKFSSVWDRQGNEFVGYTEPFCAFGSAQSKIIQTMPSKRMVNLCPICCRLHLSIWHQYVLCYMIPQGMDFTPGLVNALKPRTYAVCWLHFAIQSRKIPNRDPALVAEMRRRKEAEERDAEENLLDSDDDEDLLDATQHL